MLTMPRLLRLKILGVKVLVDFANIVSALLCHLASFASLRVQHTFNPILVLHLRVVLL